VNPIQSRPPAAPWPRTATPLAVTPEAVAAVAAGGFLGALGRYELGLAWPAGPGRFPAATFTINTSGSFLIGLVLTVLLNRFPANRYLRPFVCVGVLGAWTTMSTLAAETDLLVRGGHLAMAVGYVAATLIAGIGATVAGIGLARHLRRRS
jgi:fluoride exporter